MTALETTGSGLIAALEQTWADIRRRTPELPEVVTGAGPEGGRQPPGHRRHAPAAGEQVARMYQEPGLAWLERQAEAAEQLLAERQAGDQNQ